MRLLRRLIWSLSAGFLVSFPVHGQWSNEAIRAVESPLAARAVRGSELAFETRFPLPPMKSQLVPGSEPAGMSFDLRYARVSVGEKAFAFPELHDRLSYAHSFTGGFKRPLVVVLPDLFEGAQTREGRQWADRFRAHGYNVAVIPNAFSREYGEEYPLASPGHFRDEARLIQKALGAVRKAHAEEISEVHVFGVGYGGFLAAVVKAHDARSERPAIDGQTTLIDPFFEISETADLIDHGSRFALGDGSARALAATWLNLAERYRFHRGKGFRERAYAKAERRAFEAFPGEEEDLDRLHRQTSFYATLENFARDLIPLWWGQAREDRLVKWISDIRSSGTTGIRILAAGLNPVNDPARWTEWPAHLSDARTLLVHSGTEASSEQPWFERFWATAFPGSPAPTLLNARRDP